MGSVGKTVKNVLGLSKTDTSGLSPFQRTPEQIAAEKKLLEQLSSQAQGGGLASDIAQKKAMALGAAQSSQSSNPFLGLRAAQQAQQEGQAAAQLGAQEQLSNLLTGQRASALQAAQGQMEAAQADQARRTQFIGNLAGSAASMAKSDKNSKENIKAVQDSGGKIDEFLSKIDPYTFEYKDKALGGKQMGVMAQDLEKSDIGSAVVEDSPEGKKVRLDKIGLPILAAQSEMFKKIKELEDKVKKRA